VISLLIGKDDNWGKYRWLMIFFFGLMYGLMVCGTIFIERRPLPFSFSYALPGMIASALGMTVGLGARIVINFRKKYRV